MLNISLKAEINLQDKNLLFQARHISSIPKLIWASGMDVSLSFYFPLIGALIFSVCVGLIMMWIDTHDGKNLDKASDERKDLFW
jgi:hypothetical protein